MVVAPPPPVIQQAPIQQAPIQQAGAQQPVPVASKRSTWWILPLVIVGLVVVAWLLLVGLPFGGGDERRTVEQTATTETIAEGTAASRPMETGTVVDVGGPGEEPFATETAPQPPLATATVATPPLTPPPATQTTVTQTPAPPVTRTQPPVVVERPRTTTVAPTPAPTPAPVSREITDAEAAAVLRGHLASSNPYDVRGGCLQIRSMGYSNVGYTYSVWDSCVEGGGSRMLGRWRVDSKNRDVFRQREDGRFLRP